MNNNKHILTRNILFEKDGSLFYYVCKSQKQDFLNKNCLELLYQLCKIEIEKLPTYLCLKKHQKSELISDSLEYCIKYYKKYNPNHSVVKNFNKTICEIYFRNLIRRNLTYELKQLNR